MPAESCDVCGQPAVMVYRVGYLNVPWCGNAVCAHTLHRRDEEHAKQFRVDAEEERIRRIANES